MTTHHVAVVGEQNISGLDVLLPPVGDLRLDRVREAADEHGQAEANGDGVAISVEEADGKVLGLVDNRTVGGTHEVRLHLTGDGDDGAADDFGGERIYCGACRKAGHYVPFTSSTNCPKRFTTAVSSGPRTVTAAGSSITAGPVIRLPARSLVRS